MSQIRVDVTLTFTVDATDWSQHRDLDPSRPDEVATNFLTYVRSKTLGGLAGHIAVVMDGLTTVNGHIRLGPATLVEPDES